MLVSWIWLKDYLPLTMPPDEVSARLMMAGLNHESTTSVADDFCVDLEITSNRPDCLGHLGIAREIAVLFDLPLKIPSPSLREASIAAASLAKVRIDCPELCPRYSARVLRGVKVGPSPMWLTKRLHTIGIAVINNIVDITNFVMLECGQPLHAFDFAKVRGREIIVREARQGEVFQAIDHKSYTLEPGMCVIADAQVPVAIGGVMGGADSEVTNGTTEILIEAAEFAPMSIRSTVRKLNLHSPSSYRFERGLDPEALDWASRRCCELIQQTGGGELAAGQVLVGRAQTAPPPIVLRFSQLKRILGIEVPREIVRKILTALGNRETQVTATSIEVVPPSWRRDLTREIDLVEEVARVHGYDKIPEDVAVPMCPSHRRDEDLVISRIRNVLNAAGFDEALTASVIPAAWCRAISPWTTAEPLAVSTPMLKGADHLRVSLLPSLLEARRSNEAVSNAVIELFETARVYLPTNGPLPHEQRTLAIASGSDFSAVRGVVEAVLEALNIRPSLTVGSVAFPFLEALRSAELRLGDQFLGFLGEVTPAGLKQFGVRGATTVAELSLDVLAAAAQLVPKYSELIPYPAMTRDLNLIVDENTRWADLATTVRTTGGVMLEALSYRETYRDVQRDGAGKKRLLFTFALRAADRTLTSEEADVVRDRIVVACVQHHAAKLLA